MLSYLGDYYSHKLKAGALFAAMKATMNPDGCDENASAEAIRKELTLARSAWMSLAALGSRYYKPFVDTLRMRTENFTWAKEAEKLFIDFKVLDEKLAEINAASDKKQPALNIWPKGDLQGPSISDVKVITKSPYPGSKKADRKSKNKRSGRNRNSVSQSKAATLYFRLVSCANAS